MKTIYLVRHAKAEKILSGQLDIDRQLHPTGIAESNLIAGKLEQLNEIPQCMVSSTAARATATGLIFHRILRLDDRSFLFDRTLYDAETEAIESCVTSMDDKINSIMLFGHNPSFSHFAEKYAPGISHMPTGSAVKFISKAVKWELFFNDKISNELFLVP